MAVGEKLRFDGCQFSKEERICREDAWLVKTYAKDGFLAQSCEFAGVGVGSGFCTVVDFMAGFYFPVCHVESQALLIT